jgi:hypothetical protein
MKKMSFLLFFCKFEPSTPQLRWCCLLNETSSAHECRTQWNVLQKLSNGDHRIFQSIFSYNAELTTNNIKTSNQQETMFLLFQCILTVLIQRLRSESTGEGTDRHHPEAQGGLPLWNILGHQLLTFALHEAVCSLTWNLLLQVGAGNFPW